ncbi:sugar transferase [Janibacter limosus]|uniref:sugar transferase n=1 Tax=Janibacter limosus TaxID=53458 RepID=UPI000A064A9A
MRLHNSDDPFPRWLDLALVGILGCLTFPLVLLAAVAIRAMSGKDVLFRQQRLGRNGAPFTLLKFRTMEVAECAGQALQVTSSDDMRITAVGRLLRATKVDELPQLWNVARGDMSVVGPRPEVAKYAVYWTEQQRASILSVKPGITDPVAILFRNEQDLIARSGGGEDFYISTILPAKAAMYVQVQAERSAMKDACVIIATAGKLINLPVDSWVTRAYGLLKVEAMGPNCEDIDRRGDTDL